MDDKLMDVAMELIVSAGSARSYAMESIYLAKEGKFDEADEALANADEALVAAHHVQTDLLQRTAKGEKIETSLIMVHAQDHLMTGILAKDMAREIVELHRQLRRE
jgi:PTS system cellobiose-specific IIA component